MHFNHFRVDNMTILLFIRLKTNVRRPLIPHQEVSGSGLGLDWLDLWCGRQLVMRKITLTPDNQWKRSKLNVLCCQLSPNFGKTAAN